MSTSVVISPAVEGDVPAIFALICRLAEYEHLSHEVTATEALVREHLFGDKPAAEAIVAKVGGEAVGFALFFTTFSTFVGKPGIWLEDIFVLPEHRRGGIGKALLKEVAGIARRRGCGRLEWSVLDWNEPAIGFYRKIGAQAMSEWTIQRMSGEALRKLAEGEEGENSN
jgi:GNAT superfamily N-acetyltransferase